MVRDLHHNSDHSMVLGFLLIHPLQENKSYLGSRWRFPLKPPETAIGTREDTIFRVLHEAIPRPNPSTFPQTALISQENWYHIYPRASGRRYPASPNIDNKGQTEILLGTTSNSRGQIN